MLWILVFLLVLMVALSYLVFAPFYIEINSISGRCGLRLHHLANAQLVIKDSSLKIEMTIAGWRKQFDLLAQNKQIKNPETKKKRKPIKISAGLVKEVIRSFKVNTCYLSIDTGNTPLNGIIYPGFGWLSERIGKTVEINFVGRNEIVLEIENNIAKIIKAFIIYFFSNKNKKYGQPK